MVNLKRTRDDILVSVMDVIHHQGFQSTGLKELFAISGTSSGSFYNYFQSKNELGHALIEFKWQQIKANILDPMVVVCDDPIDGLFWMIDQLEAKHLAEPDCAGCFLGNLIVDLAKYNPEFETALQQVFLDWESAIAQQLKAGKKQLRQDIQPNLLAEQIMSMIEGVLLTARLYNDSNRLKRGFTGIRQFVRSSLIDR
ncbi:MAG: TetR/AcrR family transcriptional regulator [Thermosynechococcaceae cyanobacterium MS004]|nr:TetR/AcrR family transcriptional regulator [Thermosynechococcaceae cyanobacterium MS004]